MKTSETFWVNLSSGIVHSMEKQHVRCRLAYVKPEHLQEVRLRGPLPWGANLLLAYIDQAIALEAWTKNSSGAPRRKLLRTCVWCMSWFEEIS